MLYCYAQINLNSVCFALLQTPSEIIKEDMILIPSYNESYLGMEWTGSEWITPPPLELPA